MNKPRLTKPEKISALLSGGSLLFSDATDADFFVLPRRFKTPGAMLAEAGRRTGASALAGFQKACEKFPELAREPDAYQYPYERLEAHGDMVHESD